MDFVIKPGNPSSYTASKVSVARLGGFPFESDCVVQNCFGWVDEVWVKFGGI